jgi:hypothetical protein
VVKSLHSLLANRQDRLVAERWIQCWRDSGPFEIRQHFHYPEGSGLLAQEVWLRAHALPGPRLLVDGLWFTRPYGGVTRVWEQILSTWSLPNMLYSAAPAACLDRESHLALSDCLEAIEAERIDPLDPTAILASSKVNAELAAGWSTDVFVSSWTSSCGSSTPYCSELALVHDCLPERTPSAPAELLRCRRRWLSGASQHLAVSAATARDLEQLLSRLQGEIPWCHPVPFGIAACDRDGLIPADVLWDDFIRSAGVQNPFVFLPGTSRVGSYKNPELLARALLEPGLQSIQLVISGLNAAAYALALEQQWPALGPRIIAVGCSDLQLIQLYRHALAVVIPSRVEGFGLPVLEALREHATVLVADSPGLREAGAGAAPRVDPDNARDLAAWLRLLLDKHSSSWLAPHLHRRREQRLSDQPSADLLGLAILALARQLWLAQQR